MVGPTIFGRNSARHTGHSPAIGIAGENPVITVTLSEFSAVNKKSSLDDCLFLLSPKK
jgi:hypothetical protein